MLKQIKKNLLRNEGMTLVEVLTALTILTLIIFCFAPLFATNLKTIKTSGDKAVTVYRNTGIMQKVLGNFTTGDDNSNVGYDIDVANVPMNLSGNDGNGSYSVTALGDLIVSDPTNIENGFQTVKTDAPSTYFEVFPYEITDDFKEAYLTVAAIGTTFVDDPATSSAYKLYVNKNGTRVQLTRGTDYVIKRAETTNPNAENKILTVVLYGGGDINYANSPLTFAYKNVVKNIEISAPTMIMVGDKATDGNYYYYVSRGELDSNGNLMILQRTMNDTDAKTGNTTTLTAPMNDIEWVSAEEADSNASTSEGKYGYYAMCGDHGQIRRFWKNPATGNYYWGGDYTYYTDINLNTADSGATKKYDLDGTNDDGKGRTYSTSVSYKFLARAASIGNEGTDGFTLGHGTGTSMSTTGRSNDAIAFTQNMWTVTALDGSNDAKKATIYASDGKIIYWYADEGIKSSTWSNGPTLAKVTGNANASFETTRSKVEGQSSPNGNKIRGQGDYSKWNYEDLTWLKVDQNSYFNAFNITDADILAAGATKESYPITLTCVDSIVLNGSSSVGNSNPYAGSVTYGSWDFEEGASVNSYIANYPTSTYMLYCGYIPSAYDVWSRKPQDGLSLEFSKDSTSASTIAANETSKTFSTVSTAGGLERFASTTINGASTEKNALWRGTFGVTPYVTSGTSINISGTPQLIMRGQKSAYVFLQGTRYWNDFLYYWPYTNLKYAVTGKFFDVSTPAGDIRDLTAYTETSASENENLIYSIRPDEEDRNDDIGPRQKYLTGGDVVDITCSYLSHPFAVHTAANPSIDTKAYMVNNQVGASQATYYYSNRKETITFLNIASTEVPSGENDIPVSLAVGYAQGGTLTFSQSGGTGIGSARLGETYPAYLNNIMNIGLVYLRAGTANISRQAANGMATDEYQAVDSSGYKLNAESNYFHQFYYLNSKLDDGYTNPSGPSTDTAKDEYNFLGLNIANSAHIGNMYGCKYWQNNRHIVYRSANGNQPDSNTHNSTPNGNYNYIRCHPMVDCKVTCVAWGSTWNNYPEAMWGTDNGNVFSWWVECNASDFDSNSSAHNDKSVEAEFQSYQWIDNVEGKGFKITSGSWKSSVGVHTAENESSPAPVSYNYSTSKGTINDRFRTFFDKSSQQNQLLAKGYGFVSTLKTINDIAYSNDYWVAVGNQATGETNLRGDVISPALYCGNNTLNASTSGFTVFGTYGGETGAKAYTGNGQGGSWVNVRYWVDRNGDNTADTDNSTYLWKAVKISNTKNYNITQINNLNGIWYATGYYDANDNDICDLGEKAVVCWASDPLAACDSGQPGCWCENTQFYKKTASNPYSTMSAYEVGGINSVACRDDL
ncbi:MAG: hypothetical protein K5761_08750 [Clostridiales bacterium]|nr:hypothetical protein [Clostridiales bacterium]